MKIAVFFPGYGSQYVGMGKDVYDENRLVQEYFEEASNCLNINFVKLCFASSETELASMPNAYTTIFLLSSALYALLKQEGINPSLVAGYNIGEYSSLLAANSITLPDGLYLLNKLANFYQELLATVEVRMIHVRAVDTHILTTLCEHASRADDRAVIASYNSPTEHIVSGSRAVIEYVQQRVLDIDGGATAEDMPLEFGLHSPLMDPVARNLKIYLEKVDFKNVQVPWLSGIDGRIILHGEEIKQRVIQQIVTPIHFPRVLQAVHEYDVLVTMGPGHQLSQLIAAYYPEKQCVVINKMADIELLKNIVQTPRVET
jgi:[acyl-carrier-protein] S-malonyltransferase